MCFMQKKSFVFIYIYLHLLSDVVWLNLPVWRADVDAWTPAGKYLME